VRRPARHGIGQPDHLFRRPGSTKPCCFAGPDLARFEGTCLAQGVPNLISGCTAGRSNSDPEIFHQSTCRDDILRSLVKACTPVSTPSSSAPMASPFKPRRATRLWTLAGHRRPPHSPHNPQTDFCSPEHKTEAATRVINVMRLSSHCTQRISFAVWVLRWEARPNQMAAQCHLGSPPLAPFMFHIAFGKEWAMRKQRRRGGPCPSLARPRESCSAVLAREMTAGRESGTDGSDLFAMAK